MDSRKVYRGFGIFLVLICVLAAVNFVWLRYYKPVAVVRLPESQTSSYEKSFGSNVYAPLQVGEHFENGKLVKADTICKDPRVIVSGDVSAEDVDGGKLYGRIPDSQGAFKTVLNPSIVQEVVVVDGSSKSSDTATKCLSAVTFLNQPTDTLQIDATSTAIAVVTPSSIQGYKYKAMIESLPAFQSFRDWLKGQLQSKTLSETAQLSEYKSKVTAVNTLLDQQGWGE